MNVFCTDCEAWVTASKQEVCNSLNPSRDDVFAACKNCGGTDIWTQDPDAENGCLYARQVDISDLTHDLREE